MSDSFDFAVPKKNQGGAAPLQRPGKISAETIGKCDAAAKPASSREERRCRRRALISAPVRVRSVDVTDGGPDVISTTLDVSRGGVFFAAKDAPFEGGMHVMVAFPYCKSPVAVQAEQAGRVARVAKMQDGRFAVAGILRSGAGEDLVD